MRLWYILPVLCACRMKIHMDIHRILIMCKLICAMEILQRHVQFHGIWSQTAIYTRYNESSMSWYVCNTLGASYVHWSQRFTMDTRRILVTTVPRVRAWSTIIRIAMGIWMLNEPILSSPVWSSMLMIHMARPMIMCNKEMWWIRTVS